MLPRTSWFMKYSSLQGSGGRFQRLFVETHLSVLSILSPTQRLQEDRWRTQLNGAIHAYNTARSPNGSALIQRLNMPFPLHAHQYMSVGPSFAFSLSLCYL